MENRNALARVVFARTCMTLSDGCSMSPGGCYGGSLIRRARELGIDGSLCRESAKAFQTPTGKRRNQSRIC